MNPSETIIVRLDSVEQLLEPCPPSPFRQRLLREEAEQFLVERVTALPHKASVKLLIALPETQCGNEQRVTDAIHEDFNFRRIQAEKERHRTRRFGWRSLVVALIFLTATMLLVQLMKRYLPMGKNVRVLVLGQFLTMRLVAEVLRGRKILG
jgi:hypothetical protein